MTIWDTSHAGYLILQTHTQNMQYLWLFHYNNGCTNVPQCYVMRTLSVLFKCTRVGTLIMATIYLQLIKIDTCFEDLLSFNVVTSIVYNPLPAMWKS